MKNFNSIYTYTFCYVNMGGNGDFFQYRLNVYFFHFYVHINHKCGIVYTCFHASVLSSSMVFVWWRKTGLFNISCGTLIRMKIIPVKVDRNLTVIIRTYINNNGFSPDSLKGIRGRENRKLRLEGPKRTSVTSQDSTCAINSSNPQWLFLAVFLLNLITCMT